MNQFRPERKRVFNPDGHFAGIKDVTLNDLVTNSTIFIMAPDESMSGSMIRQGSLVAIELGATVVPGSIYYVRFRGEMLIRKLGRINNRRALIPTDPAYPREFIDDDNGSELEIYGEVVWSFFFHGNISDKMDRIISNLVKREYVRI